MTHRRGGPCCPARTWATCCSSTAPSRSVPSPDRSTGPHPRSTRPRSFASPPPMGHHACIASSAWRSLRGPGPADHAATAASGPGRRGMTGLFPVLAVEAIAVALVTPALGALLATAASRSLHADLDLPDVLALAVPAVSAYAFVLELAHIAARGHVFSEPWLVRGLTVGAALAAAAAAVRKRPALGDRPTWIALAVVSVAIVCIWGSPVARVVPLGPPGSD